MDIERK
jgi:hypothetical protein